MNKHIKASKIIIINIILIAILMLIPVCANAAISLIDPNISISPINDSEISEVIDSTGIIIGTIRTIGTVGSVLILVILGLKYIMASPEGKMELKSVSYMYLIGAVLLWGGTILVQYIYNVFKG